VIYPIDDRLPGTPGSAVATPETPPEATARAVATLTLAPVTGNTFPMGAKFEQAAPAELAAPAIPTITAIAAASALLCLFTKRHGHQTGFCIHMKADKRRRGSL
jgi:hypothetical protein